MFHRQFCVYISVIPLIVSVSYLEILRFLSVIEIYIKMSEILIFWLSALISQMAPYLIFILQQKSTHSVNMVLSSQNARLCRNCVLIRPTINVYEKRVIILGQAIVKYNGLSDYSRGFDWSNLFHDCIIAYHTSITEKSVLIRKKLSSRINNRAILNE